MSDKTYTFKDKDGTTYTRLRVRPSEVSLIRDRNAAFTASAQALFDAADGRELTADELQSISLPVRMRAVFGPVCPDVNFDELDTRELNLFGDAFWSHLSGVDPN